MTEMKIDNDTVIDDIESVLARIQSMSGTYVSDRETVKRFVTTEKNTRFYLDNNLNSYMQMQPDCIYAWIDTGFTDYYGNPILISLLQGADGYSGHVVGTIRFLADNAKRYFRLNSSLVSKKIDTFMKKYNAKADERKIKHILNEQSFLLESVHQFEETSVFAAKLAALGLEFEEQDEEPLFETEIELKMEKEPAFTEKEEEITIGLLLEQMESMQFHMDELLRELEKVSSESKTKIEELQKKNDEYKRAIVQMREYTGCTEENNADTQIDPARMLGHDLLGAHGRILVIGGQDLGSNVMHGIAKTMGFEKNDLDFVEYDKAKDFTERIRRDGRYIAIIYGACPHKTTAGAGYSSILEKFRQTEGMPYTTDARSKSGQLKVTKESFRSALFDVCQNLRMQYAS